MLFLFAKVFQHACQNFILLDQRNFSNDIFLEKNVTSFLFQDLERKVSGLLAKTSHQGCQNCILRVQVRIFSRRQLDKVFLGFLTSFGLQSLGFLEKHTPHGFIKKCNLHVRKNFLKKVFFPKFFLFPQNFFGILAKNIRHVRYNCNLRFQRNILRIHLYFEKNRVSSGFLAKFYRQHC